MSLTRPITVLCFLAILLPTSGWAQDHFGTAVVVDGDQVVILKPTNSRGPATIFVFSPTADGEWQVDAEFYPAAANETGEGFSASLASVDGFLLVGGGDPKAHWGAAAYARDAAGDWQAAGMLPLMSADSAAEADGAPLDMAGIMSILRPPVRLVALDGRFAAVAARGGSAAASKVGVAIYRRDAATGRWMEDGRLLPVEGEVHRTFGATIALGGDRAAIAAPRQGDAGQVFVFARNEGTGEWMQEAVLIPDSLERRSGFGTALAFDGERLMVGTPGRKSTPGTVTVYATDEAGAWKEQGRVLSPDEASADRFGTAFAVYGDELWVGAPIADDKAGRVYRFTRDGADGEWVAGGLLATPGVEADFRFGASIALGRNLAVVGAPQAVGSHGRAAIFTRLQDGGWSEAVWLDDGLDLEMITGEERRCSDDGAVSGFTCSNVDLLSFLPVTELGGDPGEGMSDIWGWTDPSTGREYALIGRNGGAAFVDITDPTSPVYLGVLPANRSGARDLKVYQDHLFFTGDGAGDHGLIVFDLTRLRDVENPPVEFDADAKYTGIASAHNLILDAESGFAYPVGASGGGETCGGGLHMVDIRDPLNPTFAGCYTDTEGLVWEGRTHDGQCVVYRGPDEEYQGREICFASNETALRIVDVTDKANPLPLSAGTYPGRAYIHQGWLTEDQRYFYLDDELDELVGLTDRTRTMVWDVADLEDPVMVAEYFGPTGATDHNLYIKGDRMYQANYQAGLRVVDISDPENPVEVGFFDTTPYNGDPPGFGGAWTAYPYFESGTVIVSSRAEGLFILKPRAPAPVP